MSVEELKSLLVDGFPLSKRRQMLWENFMEIVTKLTNLNIRCDVWIDGSFLTKKIDPDDVDLVIDVHVNVVENLNSAQNDFINALDKQAFYCEKKLDTYVIVNAPAGHELFPVSRVAHEQWERDFGHAYLSREPKGIARLEVAR